ncbi:uncharacterized protein LOC131148747 [Malania oleifera]|uniref:uncharacterized protein LOC131148747 n=1 Tax=Malania oleifera TaxID=397392 RepID=UPI0025AE1E69|nr:uncharacterized protein LOC131148747 [Malania oleifera]
MNRRVRSTCRSPAKRDEGFNKYLKPGALAQLRDLRISARSHRFASHSQIPLCRTLSPSSSPVASPAAARAQAAAIEGFPCFAGRIYGPRCLQRKKLVAAKSVLFLSSNPSSPASDAADPLIDVFNSDVIAAH